MADIVIGIGASHTTLMNTQWSKVDHLERAHRFRSALLAAQEQLREARVDAAVVIGSNHFRGFWLDMMPAFTIGVGEVSSSGEHGTPRGSLLGNSGLATDLCGRLIDLGFDMTFSTSLTVDHGISHAAQWILGEQPIPIVPIVINSFAPPLPKLSRALELGEALRLALSSINSIKRVAIIATGGLSHRLPFPDWRDPKSDDDLFLADSFRKGRGRWEEFEGRRREIVVNAPPEINESFDQQFLTLLTDGRLREFPDLVSESDLVRVAGNGANEIRAWLAMAAACQCLPGSVLAYSVMPEWLTGMAVAVINR